MCDFTFARDCRVAEPDSPPRNDEIILYMFYAVIMAGGSGTRLWPKSRKETPKQFHALISNTSMLKETIGRLNPIIKPHNILIVAGKSHLEAIKQQCPEIPQKNIIIEPMAKNTAPAVGLAAAILAKRDPKAIAAFIPADHFISKGKEFRHILTLAEKIAGKEDVTVTLGINPTYPETGYGYIQLGKEYKESKNDKIFWIKAFKEKPNSKIAQEYVASWQYLWNSGMFVWKISYLLNLYKKLAPKMYKGLLQIQKKMNTKNQAEIIEREYRNFKEISVDYAILEKTKRTLVVPADIGWSDVGSWAAIHNILNLGGLDNNVVIGRHIGIDTSGSLIHSGQKLIATLGLEDFVVVDTEDVLLIMPKSRAQDVKKIVEKLKEEGKEEYL